MSEATRDFKIRHGGVPQDFARRCPNRGAGICARSTADRSARIMKSGPFGRVRGFIPNGCNLARLGRRRWAILVRCSDMTSPLKSRRARLQHALVAAPAATRAMSCGHVLGGAWAAISSAHNDPHRYKLWPLFQAWVARRFKSRRAGLSSSDCLGRSLTCSIGSLKRSSQ
jgi:hypothetical protein